VRGGVLVVYIEGVDGRMAAAGSVKNVRFGGVLLYLSVLRGLMSHHKTPSSVAKISLRKLISEEHTCSMTRYHHSYNNAHARGIYNNPPPSPTIPIANAWDLARARERVVYFPTTSPS
jgi:hypothetical protein